MKNKNHYGVLGTGFSLALAAAFFCFGIGTTYAAAEVSVTVKNPDPYTGNQSWFVYTRNPGDIINDIASIKNFGDQEATVEIYPVDAVTSTGGSFILKFDHEDQYGIGDWTKIDQKEINIKPGERLDVPFAINLPEELPPGQYVGGIVIEYGSQQNGSAAGKCVAASGCENSFVTVKTRVGARIYITVPGSVEEKVAVTDFNFFTTITGQPRFKFRIENDGNVVYQPVAKIEIRDSNGKIYDSFSKSLGTVMSKSVTEPTISWDKDTPPFAKLTATADVTFNKRFQGTSKETMHGASATSTISFWIIPWSLIIYSLLLIFACMAVCFYRIVTFKRALAGSENYEVAEGEDIASIAEKKNVDWGKLAKLNRLKAPYIIKKGNIIFVPKNNKDVKTQ
jgi:hypothetical protein